MEKAIDETNRRRKIQKAYNKEHGITPQTINKGVRDLIKATIVEDINTEYGIDKDESVEDMITKLTGLSPESSKQIYINTWLIIHGIASMMATTNSELTPKEIETIIFDAFKGYKQVLMNKELNSKYKKTS